MASVLRQIVAGPRAKHQETGLDLCYVTSNIIVTSGPSQTYPQRAYRNPLDRLVAFLDARHGRGWAIWEFRAEGTGYPDDAVHGRISHYPWPDHHPPPFRLVPVILGGMRRWLAGGGLPGDGGAAAAAGGGGGGGGAGKEGERGGDGGGSGDGRVVVVHCKAGKGRSGTVACSYLIAECGWTAEDALARFTERRMRPGFGAGVSIPSQLRWVSYVDRWTKGGKKYVDRAVEIVEVHVWGLRHGVKVSVQGFVDEGKKIRVFHTFKGDERIVVEGDAPGGRGVVDMVQDMAGYGAKATVDDKGEILEDADYEGITKGSVGRLGKKVSKSKTIAMPESSRSTSSGAALSSKDESRSQSTASLQNGFTFANPSEPGGRAVIFKPATPICIPNSDVNISIERRNRAPAGMGFTMVTAVAHVWFNAFFEGQGPEQDGRADESGVFEIEWDKMDGLKGSSQKGTRALDRLSVVWRVAGTGTVGPEGEAAAAAPGVAINEPGVDSPVPQMAPADWKGGNAEDPSADKHLGLRVEDPESQGVSKASSLKSQEVGEGSGPAKGEVEADEEASLEGVKVSGPMGEEMLDEVSSGQGPPSMSGT
ncbi:uncharacterized protein THITE_34520 [Thermothielavioides terrestris NRRL 8126]|uniref:phosphatidylinositol-3,4,5-trisphosphate 3-phosphatase n=1 Tax=Thermothielavioides terrestris (strain ATCC 38088 / NRRL 8126) TaxID=578455 RepID=G2R148_THETT|nr:uncharacterized protein THITE_34520 [Thermothielavioides terrestris NRRL 8126]AEO66545.1 hypothetical protein THITE_34520 [Thermothielavioides terrestris NRRL 8126]